MSTARKPKGGQESPPSPEGTQGESDDAAGVSQRTSGPGWAERAVGARSLELVAVLLAMALGSLLVYCQVADVYFVAEDLVHLEQSWADVRDELVSNHGLPGVRPGVVGYFALCGHVCARQPACFRIPLLVLHGISAFLVYLLARRFVSVPFSMFAGIAFLASPALPEAVIWLAAAAGIVPSAFLCLAAGVLWAQAGQRALGPQHWCAGFLLLVGLLFKEAAIGGLGLLVALDLSYSRPIPAGRLASRYVPIAIALGAWLALLFASGAWRSLLAYASNVNATPHYLASVWSAYLRDLLLPLLPPRGWTYGPSEWSWATVDWFALGVTAALFGLAWRWRFRWVFVAIAAALAHGATKYVTRLSYLAVAFAALALGLAAAHGWSLLAQRLRRDGWAHRAVPWLLVVGWLGLDLIALQGQFPSWVAGAEFSRTLPARIREILPAPLAAGAKVYTEGIPRHFNGAVTLRMGIVPELRRLLGDPDLEVFIIADRPVRRPQIARHEIPCDGAASTFFVRYDEGSDRLSLVPLERAVPGCAAP